MCINFNSQPGCPTRIFVSGGCQVLSVGNSGASAEHTIRSRLDTHGEEDKDNFCHAHENSRSSGARYPAPYLGPEGPSRLGGRIHRYCRGDRRGFWHRYGLEKLDMRAGCNAGVRCGLLLSNLLEETSILAVAGR